MANASRDENHVTTELGISNADGTTLIPLEATVGVRNRLKIDDGVGGVDLSGDVDARDENRVVGFMAVSAVDGVTPVPVYVDSVTKRLLVRFL